MMNGALHIHPDDLLFFNEVAAAMRRVALKYDLPLRGISHLPMPKAGMADRLGDCSHSGDIRLVLRCTEDGTWCPHPVSPSEVWNTAAHELAHLRHMTHGPLHAEFTRELEAALKQEDRTHVEKVLEKLVKLQKHRESAAEIGSMAEAEAFAAMINKMLVEHELSPTDIDYARAADKDPIVEIEVQRQAYAIKKSKVRIAWQESLARLVARAHLCTFLIAPGTNRIIFVGTKSHATVAEYAYGILARSADYMSDKEAYYFKLKCNREGRRGEHIGYRASWLDAFIDRIAERFAEARAQAVAEATSFTGNETTALLRLDGALIKTQEYINSKFKSKKHASPLYGHRGTHNETGAQHGRAAADRMVIGQKGINPTASPKGLLS